MKEQLNVKDFSRMQKRRKAMELDVMIHWDFEHDNGEDPRARELAMTMVEQFPALRKNGTGLFLYGGPRAGKSYMAAEIVNALTDRGYKCYMTSLLGLFNCLSNRNGEMRSRLLEALFELDLLVLDDFGLALHAKEQPVDLITVIEELKRRNKLDDVGGVNYVTLLGELAVTAANVEWHAKIVADEAVLRQVAEGCNEIASLVCGGNGKSPREILGMMEQKVLGLTAQNHSNGPKQLRDAIGENMDAMSRQLERHETVTGLPTGFPQLDHLTGGLHPSDFIILAARPSMGKTSLGLNITENVALRGAKEGEAPKRVVLFSLEMSRNQLVKRMIRTEAEVGEEELCPHQSHASFAPAQEETWTAGADAGADGWTTAADTGAGEWCSRLPHAPMNAAQDEADAQEMDVLDRLWTASDKLAGASVFIDDTPGLTLQELRSKARKLKTEGGLDLIVIDYLQLMRGTTQHGGFENRQHEVSAISRGLKALARELNVPVLALSQLSRSVENRQEKRPMLSDLRESGSLEQDADIVLFLYREDYYKNTWKEALHPTELIIAKHRNGPTGKIDLFFKSDCTKFIGLDEEAV